MMTTEEFDTAFIELCEKLLTDAPERLRSAILYSVKSPGKRIRPRLSLMAAQLVELDLTLATYAAAAVELAHTYTLIHDDLPCMDDDDERRGRPSNHKVYGEATALLAGDSLLALAYDAILNAPPLPPETRVAALKILSKAVGPRGVVAGQSLEMELADKPRSEGLSAVFRLKTASLFEAALLLPVILSGSSVDSSLSVALSQFAHHFGTAFQIADDLEDLLQTDSALSQNPAHVLYYKTTAEALAWAGEEIQTGLTLIGSFAPENPSDWEALLGIIQAKLEVLQ